MGEQGRELNDTGSYWLHKAKRDLLQRDAVDAVHDAEALLRFAQDRLDGLMTRINARRERIVAGGVMSSGIEEGLKSDPVPEEEWRDNRRDFGVASNLLADFIARHKDDIASTDASRTR